MAYPVFDISGKKIGTDNPCLIIGEVAQAHDGSLGFAHAFIDAIAAAGADAVKFQTHIASAESSFDEPFRVKFSQQDETRFDYWQRMEFTEEQWAGLAKHAEERGLIFLSSPFSETAVDMLNRINMPAWKIASGEVKNVLLMEHIYKTGKPILLSSGMSSLDELDETIRDIQSRDIPVLVFQCTSKYPSQPENIGLNMIQVFKERYQIPVGLSDHSGKIYPGLAAAALGVNMIEVHVALSRDSFGPDVPVSLLPNELAQLVEGTRFIEQAIAQPVDKNEMAEDLSEMRKIFGRSLAAKVDLVAGHCLQKSDLTSKKPGFGILVQDVDTVIGKQLRNAVKAGSFIKETDLIDRG
jgi:N-acetylneuraminate synthase